jgi:ABC-type dipeptide/oligopeptide/nickel transport system permease component
MFDSPKPGSTPLRYLGRRLLIGALTLLGVATVVFGLIHLLPGDPAETMLAQSGAPPEAVMALRAEIGLDRPLIVQYGRWLAAVVQGNLGRSLFFNRPVSQLIGEQFPSTLELAVAAFVVAVGVGIPLGVIAALRRDSWIDRLAMATAVVGVAVPVFWSGLVLIWIFSVWLGWLPPAGAESCGALVMPALVLGFATAGPLARLTRATLLDVLAQPYITVARAKGLAEHVVLLRHAARNALVPLLTIAGVQLGFLLAGTVVTETLFGRPGLGRLLVDAILWRDLPVIQGVALVIAGIYVLVNLTVDLAAGWINPRVGWE